MRNTLSTPHRRRLLLNGSDPIEASAPAFSPLDLSGLWAWYDAAEISTVRTGSGTTAADNDFVATWEDRGPSARHLRDIGEAFRPRLVAAGTPSERRIVFHPGNLQLWLAYSAPVALPQPVTIFIVAAFDTLSESAAFFDGSTADFKAFCGGDNNLNLLAGGGSSLVGPALDTSRHVFTTVFDGASSSAQKDSGPISTGAAGTNSLPGLRVGGDVSGGVAGRLDGYVCEFIVVSGIVISADTASCRSYLTSKWGI